MASRIDGDSSIPGNWMSKMTNPMVDSRRTFATSATASVSRHVTESPVPTRRLQKTWLPVTQCSHFQQMHLMSATVDKQRASAISAALKQAHLAAAMVAAAAKNVTCNPVFWDCNRTQARCWLLLACCCPVASCCFCSCCCFACCFDAAFACSGRCASTCQRGLLAASASFGGVETEADIVQDHPNFQKAFGSSKSYSLLLPR